ncbi:MAG: ATP-dependent DNA helicase [Candidatus Gracilibacteria bacterium]|nr:ATP-dependent DNA helicase [Candidatus Gracilibacteria bacterium]
MGYEELYKQLNEEQTLAVDSIEGAVMVLAGPGTGKTQLLSVRTANILKQTDLYPSNILILTYTNAGVKAMRERLSSIIGPNGYEVVVETFHGFANNLLMESEQAAKLRGDRVEMTDLERINLLEYLLDNLEGVKAIRHPNAPYLYRGDIQSNIGALKRDGITPDDLNVFLKHYKADGKVIEEKHVTRLKAFAKVYEAYEGAKSSEGSTPVFDKRGRYDFDDMIVMATQILKSEPDLLAQVKEQYQYVMIDEFQDTNGSQLKFILSIFDEKRSNICVVGDDDQSIYRFQGASAGNFALFDKLFDGVKKILLHKNYRSREEILTSSAAIIRQVPLVERVMDKELYAVRGASEKQAIESHQYGTVEEELTALVGDIKKMEKNEQNNTAILVRTRKSAQLIIESFLQAGIPYTTDGKEDIRGEFRVQQLLKVLRLAVGDLDFEQKDLLLFEVLLSDFWEIDHHDLMSFASYVSKKKREYRSKNKRTSNKKPKEYQMEEEHYRMFQDEEVSSEKHQVDKPSLFEELLLRFPSPLRVQATEHDAPSDGETCELTILKELQLKKPNAVHRAAWVIKRLMERSANFPVYGLMMEFLQDAGMVDFVLKHYEDDDVLRLRELRSISSFVQNLKKANQADPGIQTAAYVRDLAQLEKHQIALSGEMVSSEQKGVKILTSHGSKGLEFQNVYIPFCIQDKAWPKRAMTNKIPLPHELMIGQEHIDEKEQQKKLHIFDENRLFYVACTRAKDRLIFSAAPKDKQVTSQFLSNAKMTPDEITSISEESTLIQLLKKEPMPDPVQFTQETLSGLVSELSLSPSSVNTYLRCKRQFLYHNLLRAPQPKNMALVYGQCVHKGLEKSYRRYMNEGKLPALDYFVDQFIQELEWHGVDQAIRQGCLHKLEDAKKWYQQQLDHGSVMPLELERKLTKKLNDNLVFTGQFDKVEAVGNQGEVRVIDYKTGTPDKHIKAIENCGDLLDDDCDEYLRQLVAYKLLYDRKHRGLRVTSASLVFVDPVKASVKKYGLEEGTFVSKTVTITDDMLKQYETLLQKVWAGVRELEFARLEEFDPKKCEYCPYKGVCWK